MAETMSAICNWACLTFAARLPLLKAGNRSPARIAMMAMTTSISTSVNARPEHFCGGMKCFIRLSWKLRPAAPVADAVGLSGNDDIHPQIIGIGTVDGIRRDISPRIRSVARTQRPRRIVRPGDRTDQDRVVRSHIGKSPLSDLIGTKALEKFCGGLRIVAVPAFCGIHKAGYVHSKKDEQIFLTDAAAAIQRNVNVVRIRGSRKLEVERVEDGIAGVVRR